MLILNDVRSSAHYVKIAAIILQMFQIVASVAASWRKAVSIAIEKKRISQCANDEEAHADSESIVRAPFSGWCDLRVRIAIKSVPRYDRKGQSRADQWLPRKYGFGAVLQG